MTDPTAPEPAPVIAALGRRAEFREWLSGLEGAGLSVAPCDDASVLSRLVREGQVAVLIVDAALGVDAGALLELVGEDASGLPLLLVADRLEDRDFPGLLGRGHAWCVPRTVPARELVMPLRAMASRRTKERAQKRLLDELTSRLRVQEAWNTGTRRRMEELLHELRTPASVVLTLASSLLEGAEGPLELKQRVLVERMRAAADLVAELISSTRQKLPPASGAETRLASARRSGRRPIALDELAEQVRSVFAEAAAQQGVTLHVETRGELPDVWADRTRLGQLLVNLMSNALRATAAGGEVRMIIAPEPANEARGAACRLTVADTGTGIAPEDRPHVFTFGWSASGRAGLGLTVCKQIAAEHQGELLLESTPGQGSSFHLILPVDPRARTVRAVLQVISDPAQTERLIQELRDRTHGAIAVNQPEDIEALARTLLSSGGQVVLAGALESSLEQLLTETQ